MIRVKLLFRHLMYVVQRDDRETQDELQTLCGLGMSQGPPEKTWNMATDPYLVEENNWVV